MNKSQLLSIFALTLTLAAFAPMRASAEAGQSCNANCPGGTDDKLEIDVEAKCMCVDAENCFKVDIGSAGPQMTAEGTPTEKIKGCQGSKYQEKPQPTAQYDNDCLQMNIPANDGVGKWIHKTQGCQEGGNQATLGCIAVPCDKWPELVKETKGKKSVAVCHAGGKSGSSSGSSTGNSSNGNGTR